VPALGTGIAENAHTPAARREYTHPERSCNLENLETVEDTLKNGNASEADAEEPGIVDDICVEELAIDGICGVY
jgi:mycofactocin precursor